MVYLRRADRQVKVRGQRVELGEIEAVLAGDGVARAAVEAIPETRPGHAWSPTYPRSTPRMPRPCPRTPRPGYHRDGAGPD